MSVQMTWVPFRTSTRQLTSICNPRRSNTLFWLTQGPNRHVVHIYKSEQNI